MISRVVLAAAIAIFVFAHGVAVRKMHAMEHVDRTVTGATVSSGD